MSRTTGILAAAALATAALAASAGEGVRIGAWNMKWFPSGFPVTNAAQRNASREYKRIDSAARFMCRTEADVVILEEVRDRATCDLLVSNDALKGWVVNVCSDFSVSTRAAIPPHQNAVVSRHRAVDAGWHEWKREGEARPPRGIVWAVYDFSSNLTAVVGVHLKSNYVPADDPDPEGAPRRNRALREISSRQLLAFVRELQAKDYGGRKVARVIVGGDFNTSLFDDGYKAETTIRSLLGAGFRDCFDGVVGRDTMPATRRYPATCFDYLLFLGTAEIFAPVVSLPQYTSDHCMISVVVR